MHIHTIITQMTASTLLRYYLIVAGYLDAHTCLSLPASPRSSSIAPSCFIYYIHAATESTSHPSAGHPAGHPSAAVQGSAYSHVLQLLDRSGGGDLFDLTRTNASTAAERALLEKKPPLKHPFQLRTHMYIYVYRIRIRIHSIVDS